MADNDSSGRRDSVTQLSDRGGTSGVLAVVGLLVALWSASG
ncbi:hypothetical protein AB0D86_25920 [Streptomyces sp. NPDC048324]